MEKDLFLDHLRDLAAKSSRQHIYTWSAFLSQSEQQQFLLAARDFPLPWRVFGGAEGCERQLLCFGDPEEIFAAAEPPICCLQASPVNRQFADRLTHRDFLGSLLSLGIDRSVLGDIIIRGDQAYIFVLSHMADFICRELRTVKHTTVQVEKDVLPPEGEFFTLEAVSLPVTSLRADVVIAALYRLSRSQSQELFRRELVYCSVRKLAADSVPAPGALVSVRGYGRFRMGETTGQSRKGKYYLTVEKYI